MRFLMFPLQFAAVVALASGGFFVPYAKLKGWL